MEKKARKGITTSEFMKQLANNPEYQERLRQTATRNAEVQRIARLEERKVIAEIRALGAQYGSFAEMRVTFLADERARQVVENHLSSDYSLRTIDDLLRVLESGGQHERSWHAVRRLFDVRGVELMNHAPIIFGTLVYTLGVLATESVLPQLLSILGNTVYGIHRNSILDGTEKLMLSSDGLRLAGEFQPDTEIAKRYQKMLGKWRRRSVRQLN